MNEAFVSLSLCSVKVKPNEIQEGVCIHVLSFLVHCLTVHSFSFSCVFVHLQTAGELEAVRDVELSKVDASAMDVAADGFSESDAEDGDDENSDDDR